MTGSIAAEQHAMQCKQGECRTLTLLLCRKRFASLLVLHWYRMTPSDQDGVRLFMFGLGTEMFGLDTFARGKKLCSLFQNS